jgi:hypothetical protein
MIRRSAKSANAPPARARAYIVPAGAGIRAVSLIDIPMQSTLDKNEQIASTLYRRRSTGGIVTGRGSSAGVFAAGPRHRSGEDRPPPERRVAVGRLGGKIDSDTCSSKLRCTR